jgi:hypothetical protein
MVVHASNSSIQKAKAGGSHVQGQPGLYSEFQGSLGYVERPYFKTNKQKNDVTQGKQVSHLHVDNQSVCQVA